MKVKIKNKSEDMLEVQVFGEGHTLCAPLNDLIFEDMEKIKMAGYKIKHPLIPDPTIYIKAREGISPEKILLEVTEKFQSIITEFEAKYKEALEKFKG